MQKTIHFILCSLVCVMLSHAQSNLLTSNQTNQFNFKKANNSLFASYITFSSNAIAIASPYGERGKAYYQEKLRKAKNLRIGGIVMASLGGAALAGTIAGTVYLVRNRTKLYDGGIADVYKIYGLAVGGTGLSAGLIGAGIPLSISGSRKVKKYNKVIADNNF